MRALFSFILAAQKLTFGGLIACSVFASSSLQAQQNENWWFDVEVILFKRNIDGSQLNEDFPFAITAIDLNQSKDLIGEYLIPNSQQLQNTLALCHTGNELSLPLQTTPAFEINESLFQALPPDPLASYDDLTQSARDYELQNDSQTTYDPDVTGSIKARGEQLTPPPVEDFQMAFSMPTNEAEKNEENDFVGPKQEPKEESAQEPPALAFASESRVQLGNSEEIEAFAQTQGALASTDENLTEPETPLAIYEPIKFISAKDELGLINWEVPSSLACVFPNERQDTLDEFVQRQFDDHYQKPEARTIYPDSIPESLDGLPREDIKSAYILPQSSLQLRKLARDLNRRRGINSLLHFAWRQHVSFGKNNAQSYRISAGKNYSSEYSYEGYPLLPEIIEETPVAEALPEFAIPLASNKDDELMLKIRSALAEIDKVELKGPHTESGDTLPILEVPQVAESLKPEQVWELDGFFKLYLQNIGRVPYLHIDSEFNYRQPTILEDYQLPEEYMFDNDAGAFQGNAADNPTYFLKPYRFQQLRRIISRQIHYFDHPMFGMVVQIRRYRLPYYMQ